MFRTRKFVRIAVPVALGGLALGAALGTPSLASAQSPTLPTVTTTQLVTDVLSTKPAPLSGTVVASASLLGSLSSLSSQLPGGVSLPGGTATVNVWVGASRQFRAQILNSSSERDLYVNGSATWLWNSSSNQAIELVPSSTAQSSTVSPSMATYDPQVEATNLLKALAPTTSISLGTNTYVGGRPAYVLRLTPLDHNSLFGYVDIYVDASTSQVLGVDVVASDGTQALSVKFSGVTFAAPNPNVFVFTPPATASVKKEVLPSTTTMSGSTVPSSSSSSPSTSPLSSLQGVKFTPYGHGWSTVAVSSSGAYSSLITGLSTKDPQAVGLLKGALQSVSTPFGEGKFLSTPLVDVLVLPNGTILAGSVNETELLADASLVAG
ncbi:MAG: LolA family protein [Acidimicrobiales bacterium]